MFVLFPANPDFVANAAYPVVLVIPASYEFPSELIVIPGDSHSHRVCSPLDIKNHLNSHIPGQNFSHRRVSICGRSAHQNPPALTAPNPTFEQIPQPVGLSAQPTPAEPGRC